MRLLGLYLLFLPIIAQAACLTDSVEGHIKNMTGAEKIIVIKKFQHELAYSEESCGASGCEIHLFSEVYPGCLTETLDIKGFYINDGLQQNYLLLRVKNKKRRFFYNKKTKQFQ